MKKFHIGWLVGVLVLFVLFPQGVDAHAQIQRSSPAAESELSRAPREIRITYTENINSDLSTATLSSGSGVAVPVKLSTENDNVLILTPSSDLADGVYKVKWQVLSVDTHVTEGSFRFAVGVKLDKVRPHDTISLDGDTPTDSGQLNSDAGTTAVNPSTDVSKSPDKKPQQPTSPKPDVSGKAEDTATSKSKGQVTSEKRIQAIAPEHVRDKGKVIIPGQETLAADTESSESAAVGSPSAGLTEVATGGASSASADQGDEPSKDGTPANGDGEAVGANKSASVDSTPSSQGSSNDSEEMSGMDHSHHDMDGMDMGDMEGMDDSGITFDWNKLLRVIELFAMSAIGGIWYVRSFLLVKDRVPADNLAHRIFTDRTERMVFFAAILVFLCTGIAHLLQLAVQLNTSGTLDAEAWSNTGVLLRSTLIGTVVWVRPILLAVLVVSSFALAKHAVLRMVAQGVLLTAIAVTFPMTGHSWANDSIRIVTVPFDLLHLVMAVVWFGGLAGLGVMVWRLPKQRDDLEKIHQTVRRFSQVALPLIATVAITGLLLSLIRITTWDAFFHSDYGQTLMWKIILFIVILLLAGVQRFVILPYLQREHGMAEGWVLNLWMFSIRAELCLAIIIFIVAGFLSTTSPPMS
ncbi:copper resistance CopC/CopD family protein [Paenibacillus guangzhouensis]|uniref:copper resistance CopC/CopD family protein n=1 Tax=Paenibacillus guangzhouensis TaxID=1473112 RepID=UPI00187B524A|nr:copper resistance protein CopC [Paenibacillus guangzhouensis]